MKYLLFALPVLGLILFLKLKADEKPVESELNFFKGTFSQALAESAKQNKPVFMDAYTNWCGWCKKLDRTTFADKEVSDYLNQNFIILKVNMEEGEGVDLADKYGINSFPTLLFINEKGEAFHGIGGYANQEEFLYEAQKAKTIYENN
ncbi:MAG: thioredoxin family protein [Bacteroidia bacterium]